MIIYISLLGSRPTLHHRGVFIGKQVDGDLSTPPQDVFYGVRSVRRQCRADVQWRPLDNDNVFQAECQRMPVRRKVVGRTTFVHSFVIVMHQTSVSRVHQAETHRGTYATYTSQEKYSTSMVQLPNMPAGAPFEYTSRVLLAWNSVSRVAGRTVYTIYQQHFLPYLVGFRSCEKNSPT